MFLNGANVDFVIDRATTDLRIAGNADGPTINEWNFAAVRWDLDGASGDQQYYTGLSDKPAVEVGGYTLQTVGAGTRNSDAAGVQELGDFAGVLGFTGNIGFAAIWNRRLSLGEIREQQFRPRPSYKNMFFVFPDTLATIQDRSPFRVTGSGSQTVLDPYRPLPMTVDIGIARPSVGFLAAVALAVRDPIHAVGVVPFGR